MSNRFSVALVILCGLTACGDAGPEDPRTLSGVPGDDGADPAPEFGKLTATIGPDGGEIVGDQPGFDGFRLLVPAGALTEDTEITVELAIDPTPLPELGTAIGPQYRVLPANLAFTQPASITLPFDDVLRQQGDATDEECQAWMRTEGDWTGIAQTASTPSSVTVPMPETGVIGAGLFIKPLAISCLNCKPVPPPNCVAGGELCLEKIGTQHAPMLSSRTWYTQGVIYWLAAPSSNAYTLVGFDTLTQSPVATPQALTNLPLAATLGDVVVDKNGSKWLGLNFLGNVEFKASGLPIRYDSGSTTRAMGVVLDRNSGAAIRLRTRPVTIQNASYFALSGVRENLTMEFGAFSGAFNVASLAPGVTLSAPIALALAGNGATSQVKDNRSPTLPMARATKCGSRTAAFMNGPVSHPRKARWTTFCTDDLGGSSLQLWDGSGSTPQIVRQTEVDPFTLNGAAAIVMDSDENWWISYASIPQLTQVRTDGGIVTYPLTTASIGSSTYNSMLAKGMHYEASLDTLYLVTRGTGARGDIYEITNLP